MLAGGADSYGCDHDAPGRPAVMGLHRLTAGAGYQYLLKHTASGDCDRAARDPLVGYYAEDGLPPGRWMGAGLEGLATADGRALSAGSVVTEGAMASLFGAGHHPLTHEALGREYRRVAPASERIAVQVQALPADMTPETRTAAIATITHVELRKPVPRTVAGFDLTFTPVKSVSTLWALGDRRTQAAVVAAHRAAVAQTLAFIEDWALFTRTGTDGCRQESVRGLVAAGFDHWDSRAGDPNLHTHVVVANKVQGLDGQWRSVDSRALHHAVVAASETYDALLTDELSRRLTVGWSWRARGPRRSPGFELDGVDQSLLTEFSSRSTQIDEAMTARLAAFYADHGRSPNQVEILRLRSQVTRSTRPGKTVRPLADLVASWRDRAFRRTGRTPEETTAQVLRRAQIRPLSADRIPDQAVEDLARTALEQVMTRRSTWTRWNVHAEAARVSRSLAMAAPEDRVALLGRITDTALAWCVSLEAPAIFGATGRYARPDGSSVFDRPSEDVHTHPAVLAAEARLLAATSDLTAPTAAPIGLDGVTSPASGWRVPLVPDQVDAVRQLALSAARLDVLVGPAGSGKTTTLLALRHVWEHTHGRGSVIGLATSSTAAAQLAGALGIACENTAKWLHEATGPGAATRAALLAHLRDARATATDPVRQRTIDTAAWTLTREQDRWRMRPGQLVIVDEASLAATTTLDRLTAQATAAGAKVVLVGDDAQLSAVDAGGAFALLTDRARPARLTSLWRFTQPWEADATLALRDGDPRVLDAYLDRGRIHDGPAEAMLEDAYAAWQADTAAGLTSVLIAPDATSVAALNHRAHTDRVSDGLVTPGGLTTHAGATIGVGDRVVTRSNDRRLRVTGGGWVRNGDLWDVTAINDDGSLTVTRATGALRPNALPGEARVPRAYVAEHVEHGYATTTHRAQGITTTTAHVLARAGMTRENLYVAMTRGRTANHAYVATDLVDPDCDSLPDVHAPRDAHDVLTTILTTTGAQTSATAMIAAKQNDAGSLRRLGPIRDTLLGDASNARWTALLTCAGLASASVQAIVSGPESGTLLSALDRASTLAGDPVHLAAELLKALDPCQPGLAADLRAAANDWIARRASDPHDIPQRTSGVGLDAAGLAIFGEVEAAITQRTAALTDGALGDRPTWLTALGPEPPTPAGRAAWLYAVATTAAHLDLKPAIRTVLATTAPDDLPAAARSM